MSTPAMSTPATTTSALAPRLVVSDGNAALQFYAEAFSSEATDVMHQEGRLVNAHVLIGTTLVGVVEEDGQYNTSPTTVGGSPVILSLSAPSADEAGARFVQAGGHVIIPIDDRPYGRRDGRFQDPFGHLWIFGQELG